MASMAATGLKILRALSTAVVILAEEEVAPLTLLVFSLNKALIQGRFRWDFNHQVCWEAWLWLSLSKKV